MVEKQNKILDKKVIWENSIDILNHGIPNKTNLILNSNVINSINQIVDLLKEIFDNILNDWLNSNNLKKIFRNIYISENQKDILNSQNTKFDSPIQFFHDVFAKNIILFFIKSAEFPLDKRDCPYLEKLVNFLTSTQLSEKDVNIICWRLKSSIKDNINCSMPNYIESSKKFKFIDTHYLEKSIDVIMDENLNHILDTFSKKNKELDKKKNQKLEEQNKKLEKQNKKLEKQNFKLNELKDSMNHQLSVLRTILNELDEKNKELDGKNSELDEKKNQLEKTIKELNVISNTDELTWIANRRKFNEIFKDEVEKAKRTDRFFSLIVIDIDYFKNFNDTFWHDNWDIVLKKISNTIKDIVRDSDTFARYWWEEFIIILPETDIIWWITLAEKIRKSIEDIKLWDNFILNWKNINLTVSQWVCTYNWEKTSDQVFKKADLALYDAKDSWRNAVCVNES